MKAWLLSLTLVAVALAGCADDVDETPIEQETGWVPGLYAGHPAYGFLASGDLPVTTDGKTRVVADDGTVKWFRPAGKPTPELPAALEHVAHVDTGSSGHGIAVFGGYAFVGNSASGPLHVVDFSDPTTPMIVGTAADVPVRDADTILYPDGRLIVITTAGGSDQFGTDVTDPANPFLAASLTTDHGNHNIAVVPGTPIVYNSGSGGIIDIVDWSDPEDPVPVGTFQNGGCHDITFYIDPVQDKYRAYCASSGTATTQIWDIADPLAPQKIIDIPYPGIEQGAPLALPDSGARFPLSIDHLAMSNHDGTVLILGDETGGGGINGCDYYIDGESGPLGNLWFYDVTDEANPVLHGHLSPEAYDDPADPTGSCTSHFGRLVEDTGFLVMSFYTSGVLLVDFRDLDNPVIADRLVPPGSDMWDVWYQDGYLVTGDIARGLDILELM